MNPIYECTKCQSQFGEPSPPRECAEGGTCELVLIAFDELPDIELDPATGNPDRM